MKTLNALFVAAIAFASTGAHAYELQCLRDDSAADGGRVEVKLVEGRHSYVATIATSLVGPAGSHESTSTLRALSCTFPSENKLEVECLGGPNNFTSKIKLDSGRTKSIVIEANEQEYTFNYHPDTTGPTVNYCKVTE